MRIRSLCQCVLLCLVTFLIVSCSKKEPEDLIVGPWRMEGGDTVYTFRQNQGWISLKAKEETPVKGKEGESAETGKEGDAPEKGKEGEAAETGGEEKVEGQWAFDRPEGEKKIYLSITPSETVDETPWRKGKPVRFELVEISLKELVLKRENGDLEKWLKLGKHTEGDAAVVPGVVTLPLAPLVVNLRRERENEALRYLCMKIDLVLKNGEGLDYVRHVVEPESKKESYHIHPRINDVTLMYLSSLYYKDVKTLDRVKVVLTQYKKMLDPYFEGKLMYVNLTKVVVTPKSESAMEFKKDLPAEETEGKSAAEGENAAGGHEEKAATGGGEAEGHGKTEGEGAGEVQKTGEGGHGGEEAVGHGAEKSPDNGEAVQEAPKSSH